METGSIYLVQPEKDWGTYSIGERGQKNEQKNGIGHFVHYNSAVGGYNSVLAETPVKSEEKPVFALDTIVVEAQREALAGDY